VGNTWNDVSIDPRTLSSYIGYRKFVLEECLGQLVSIAAGLKYL
jgi:hypothetical protein